MWFYSFCFTFFCLSECFPQRIFFIPLVSISQSIQLLCAMQAVQLWSHKLCVFKQNKGPCSDQVSSTKTFSGAAGSSACVQRGRRKESRHSSSATEHQCLVFPELLSSHFHAFLLNPLVGGRPECSSSLVRALRCVRPVTAGKDRQWALV